MPATEMTPGLLVLVAGASLVLAAALGALFHRGRSALAALVLLWLWLGLWAGDGAGDWAVDWAARLGTDDLPTPRLESLVLFAPLDLLLIVLFVETSVLSWRGVLILGLLVAQTLLAVLLPAAAWDALWELERWPARALPGAGEYFMSRGWPAPGLSTAVAAATALTAVGRWWWSRDSVQLGMAAAAAALAYLGYGLLLGATPALPLLCAGVALLVSVAHASYRMAFLDPLTGLPGRRMLDERMARLGGRWAVAMVDVDHFKKFNDTHGHDVGDQVLKMVAATLRRHFGHNAYRYGGEEFTVLFTGRQVAQARVRCDAFRADVAARRLQLRGADRPQGRKGTRAGKRRRGSQGRAAVQGRGSGKRVRTAKRAGLGVTVSVGIALRSATMRRPEVLLKAADVALYRAKSAGRDQVAEHA